MGKVALISPYSIPLWFNQVPATHKLTELNLRALLAWVAIQMRSSADFRYMGASKVCMHMAQIHVHIWQCFMHWIDCTYHLIRAPIMSSSLTGFLGGKPLPAFVAVFNLVCQKYQVELGHKLVVCKPTSTRLVKLGQKAEMVIFAKSGC